MEQITNGKRMRATKMIVNISPQSLAEAIRQAADSNLPPVEGWNPPHRGDIDMVIRRDGSWLYQGSPITRHRMVRLFSTILRREGDSYFLVTPVEKLGITVEDVPFVAVDVEISGAAEAQSLRFTTNVGDRVLADVEHPIRLELGDDGEPSPYVMVRAGLEARIDRKSFYRLADLGMTQSVDGTDWFGLWSGGVFFPLMAAEEIGLK